MAKQRWLSKEFPYDWLDIGGKKSLLLFSCCLILDLRKTNYYIGFPVTLRVASLPYSSKIKFSPLEWDDAKSPLRLVLGPKE